MNEFLLCFLICLVLLPAIYAIYRIGERLDEDKKEERRNYNSKLIDEEK